MEERQARLMGVMAILLLVLGSFLLWSVYGAPVEERDEEATVEVWNIAYDDVRAIHVQREKDAIRVERRDDVWRLSEPVDYRANWRTVHEMLDSLREIRFGIPVDGEAEVFGLEPAEATLLVTMVDGTEHTLLVGYEAPVDRRTYVRTPGGPIAAVDGRPREPALRPVAAWRDTRLMLFEVGDVRRITIEGPEGTLSVFATDDGRWWMDGFTRANMGRVDDLAMGLLDLHFSQFTPGAADHIADPLFRVSVDSVDGTSVAFSVGESTPMGRLVVLDDGTAGVVEPQSLALLGQGPVDLGGVRAFPFDEVRDDEVVIEGPGDKKTVLTRHGARWKVGDEEVDALMAAFRDARIHYRQRLVPEVAQPPMLKVDVCCPARTVTIGQREEEFRTAQDGAGGLPYLIPAAEIEVIMDALP
jgi:hypothetical protein